MESDTTSHPRQSILTSFLRGGSRPRSSVNSPTTDTPAGAGPPGINLNNSRGAPGNRGRVGGGALGVANGQSAAGSTSPSASLPPNSQMPMIPGAAATSFSQMLRRRRSNNGPLAPSANAHSHNANASANTNGAGNGNPQSASAASPVASTPTGPAHRIRLVPHLENSRALHFEPITRECREGAPPIRIGRFTDRTGTLAASTNSLTGKIAFKSKVVSRGHAEIWCEANAKFYIKDTSSSSGTFLNHMRLSHAGVESRPFMLKDGDILQLGVDYQGGTEEIYRCVKIRVEIGREWQAGPNAFNTSALAQLRSLSNLQSASSAPAAGNPVRVKTGGSKAKTSVSDCCICLFPVTVCQALFIAPCSHSFHYKCIRGTLWEHHPGFSCPLCRSFHDLEADVEHELPQEEEEWEDVPEEDPAELSVVSPDLAGADNDEPRPASARSLDDDDLPLRTAAEDNDRRVLLPQSHTTPTLQNRRGSRRGAGNNPDQTLPPLPSAPVDETDRGFETDGAVMGYGGAETDMDLDDPHPRHGSRSNSTRNRSTIYNLVHAGTLPPQGANGSFHGNGYAGNAGMNSAPNLLRPGSALGHAHHGSNGGNEGSGPPGTSTPPIPYMSTSANFRTNHGNNEMPSRSSTGNGSGYAHGHAPRSSLPGSLQGTSSASHLFGDSGAGASASAGAIDKAEEGLHEEDHTIEGSLFGLGGKRKR